MKLSVGIRIVGLSLSFVLVAGLAIPGMSGARKSTSNIYAAAPSTIALDSLEGLEIQAAHEKGLATYGGRRALHLLNDDSVIVKGNSSGGQSLAIVKGSDFKDGTIEVEVVGLPRQGSPPDTRGFVGLAFHVRDHGSQFEAFYLRFTSGRPADQLRRNRITQYVSEPDFPWFRLREENPGMYESYVDIEPKAWTKLNVIVTGTKARLYINNATQPCLIVNDLKLGDTHG
jgi:hypothetical protein